MTRNVEAQFNETRNISVSVYSAALVAVVAVPMYFFFNDATPDLLLIVTAGGIGIGCFVVLAALFLPKFWAVQIDKDVSGRLVDASSIARTHVINYWQFNLPKDNSHQLESLVCTH